MGIILRWFGPFSKVVLHFIFYDCRLGARNRGFRSHHWWPTQIFPIFFLAGRIRFLLGIHRVLFAQLGNPFLIAQCCAVSSAKYFLVSPLVFHPSQSSVFRKEALPHCQKWISICLSQSKWPHSIYQWLVSPLAGSSCWPMI